MAYTSLAVYTFSSGGSSPHPTVNPVNAVMQSNIQTILAAILFTIITSVVIYLFTYIINFFVCIVNTVLLKPHLPNIIRYGYDPDIKNAPTRRTSYVGAFY